MSRSTILLAKDHNLSVRIMRDVNYILKFSVKTSVDLADIIGLLSLHYLRKMIIVQNKLSTYCLDILPNILLNK